MLHLPLGRSPLVSFNHLSSTHMKASTLLTVSLGILLSSHVSAQIHVPLSSVSLAYPSAPPTMIDLGGSDRYILPTPFVLSGSFNQSALWICMDPLKEIFYNQSGEPAGAFLNYTSKTPGAYIKWNPGAPGLNLARQQHLADLFKAYTPTRTDGLIGAALALAVPEITNEFDGNNFSLSSGQFRAWGDSGAASVLTLAQTMLNRLGDADVAGKGDLKSLKFLTDGTYTNRNGTVPVQELVGFVPVPEPSTYALGAMAVLLPVIAFRVRRQRAATSLPLQK
jgi:hypothetical protein